MFLKTGEGIGNPLQYSCLENPLDGGAWWATVHGVAKSRTRLSNFTFTFKHYQKANTQISTIKSQLNFKYYHKGNNKKVKANIYSIIEMWSSAYI